VTPDVSVCAEDAMRTAQIAILTKMAESGKNTFEIGRLKARIAELGIEKPDGAKCR
jgi:hypothetical protein